MGTYVKYELLEGALVGVPHEVRYLHMAAVSPALLAAWVHAKSRPDGPLDLVVPEGTEIGLLGCQAVLDSPPHLHLDFGYGAGAEGTAAALDPGCFIELGSTGDYWCCSHHHPGRPSGACRRDHSSECLGTAGTPMCTE